MKENEKELLINALEHSKSENGQLIVPKEIENIDNEFCELCKKFEVSTIKFEVNNNLKIIEPHSFTENDFLTHVDFSNCKKLKSIGKQSFMTCKNLKVADFSGCEKLEDVQFLIFRYCDLDLLDFSNCKNIAHFDNSAIRTKVVRFNYNLENSYAQKNTINCPVTFKSIFFTQAHIEIYDEKITKDKDGNKKKELKLVKDFDVSNAKLASLKILNLGIFKRLKQLEKIENMPKFSVGMAYTFKDKKEAELIAYNWKFFDDLHTKLSQNQNKRNWSFTPSLNPFGYFGIDWNFVTKGVYDTLQNNYNKYAYACYNTFRILGLFGFDGVDKQKILQYKMLLSKEYLKANHKEISQQSMQNVANTLDFQTLISSFILTKIVPHKNKINFLAELHDFPISQNLNIDFTLFLVNNIDEILSMPNLDTETILKKNKDFDDLKIGSPLSTIYKNFNTILKQSNKKVLTRQNKERLTLADCQNAIVYNSDCIKEGNEELAKLCGAAHLDQKGFEFLQELFEKGKEITKSNEQILKCSQDTSTNNITYEIVEKDNPLGLVLGNITNCCQTYDGNGEDCMRIGEIDPTSSFMALRYKGDVIAQSWMWYDKEHKVVALDNIEVPEVARKLINTKERNNTIACIQRLCDNIFKTMNSTENKVEHIVIGKHCTDLCFLKDVYNLENDNKKMFQCPYEKNGEKVYSDISKQGQFIVYKDGTSQFITPQEYKH